MSHLKSIGHLSWSDAEHSDRLRMNDEICVIDEICEGVRAPPLASTFTHLHSESHWMSSCLHTFFLIIQSSQFKEGTGVALGEQQGEGNFRLQYVVDSVNQWFY